LIPSLPPNLGLGMNRTDFPERHLVDRQTYKARRSAALAEWRSVAV